MIDRRQKKCLLGSALFHGVLLLVLLVGPGFLTRKPPALPVIDYIPDEIVDALLHGGGNPRVTTPPAPPPPAPEPPKAQPQPQVKAREPEPVPVPPKPVPKADTLKVVETRKTQPKPTPKAETTKPVKSTPKISTRIVTRNDSQLTKQREAERKAREKATKDRLNSINTISKSISRNLSDSVSVEVPGPGGKSVANWAQVVHSIYDRAWV